MFPELVGRRLTIAGQFTEPVVVQSAEAVDGVVVLQVRTASGALEDAVLDPEELERVLSASAEAAPTGLLQDHEAQFLIVESARIRLAYAFDPFFAVSMSGIQPLPHQLEAVYRFMLPQPRLRFLLADDPGAGKTIMAGLLLKELRLRHAVDRVLILSPAPLTIQWQDEMASKFDEVFERVQSANTRDQLAGSPWSRFPQCIASMDFAKQENVLPDLLQEGWDLVIIDEAHKVSMPDRDHPTQRFRLANELAERTERLLLLTATPHQGHGEQFRNLLSLLDEHAFRDENSVQRLLAEPNNPWILRRSKEELRDFEGRKLFVPRHAYTEEFTLDPHEWALYDEVNRYINRYFGKKQGGRKATAALTRLVFQRRLASSLRAIRVSLERREQRVKDLVGELRALPEADRQARLLELAGYRPDPEMAEDDLDHEALDDEAAELVSAQRLDELEREVEDLGPLVDLARTTEARGRETKFDRLVDCLKKEVLADLHEPDGKLLIFTEQRTTLEMLHERLTARGFDCVTIHGGMDALARKEAQYQFQTRARICIATDAAGEGINLQFCHLMINYDVPWNPNRLEQRMGRIHRFGQAHEVHVFNFVASSGPEGPERQPVVEGQVIATLLEKLARIRDSLGDRVYDVVGMLLRLNQFNLEEVIRDATLAPSEAWRDFLDDIEAIDEERLRDFERMTGIALAKHTVDLARIKGQDLDHEERRLMPEYVEEWFRRAATRVNLQVRLQGESKLFSVPHVPEKLRAGVVATGSRRGRPEKTYRKLTFWKEAITGKDVNAELCSPIHPLYGALEERLANDLVGARAGVAHWLDPFTTVPYRVHFYTMRLDGESLGHPNDPPRVVEAYGTLVAVREDADGTRAVVSPDLLHDLSPAGTGQAPPHAAIGPDDLKKAEQWVRARVQHPKRKEIAEERTREVEIRRRFLEAAFAESMARAEASMWDLQGRVVDGESDAALAFQRAEQRLESLREQRALRFRALEHLEVVRTGPITHLGSAVVTPPGGGPLAAARDADPEVERIAYDLVQQYEEAAGRQVTRVYMLGDGCGFDLRSEGPGPHDVRRIEVKGHGGAWGGAFLTPNEWRKAKRFRDSYWLYVVWGCTSGNPRLRAIQDPFGRLDATEVSGVVHYSVSEEELVTVDAEEWRG